MKEKEDKIIIKDISYDKVFKSVFSDKDVLKMFFDRWNKHFNLKSKIKRIKISSQKLIASNSYFSKDYYGDIIVETSTETYFIEMCRKFNEEAYKKCVNYAFRLYTKKPTTGKKYVTCIPVKGIIFMNGNYNKIAPNLFNEIRLINPKFPNNIIDENVVLYLIRVDKLKTIVYDKNESSLVTLLRILNAKTYEDLTKLEKEDKNMRYLIRRFIDFIRDPWYEPIVETLADQKKWIKKEGKEEGIKIGTKRTNINVAKAMIKENISEDTITKITGLPIKEIEKLRNHN